MTLLNNLLYMPGVIEIDMKKLRYLGILSFFIVLLPFVTKAQNTSNKGKDFWLGYANHFSVTSQKMVLYITSDVNTSGEIEIPGLNYNQTFTVTANSVQTVTIPQTAYLPGEGLYNTGIHVTAEQPVVVYAHIYDQRVSGATLVLPVTALGKEYYSINYKQISNEAKSFSYFLVVATEDNTEVEIIPSATTSKGWKAGESHVVRLNKGQVYQVLGEETGRVHIRGSIYNYNGADLTGSKIRSISTTAEPCKRIAVFSGSGKIGIGCGSNGVGASDNLYQQVYPTATWGKKFISVPLSSRSYDVIRVLKSDPTANVTVNGTLVPNSAFTNNFYYDFNAQSVNTIEADKPIQVAQYAVSMTQGFNCMPYVENTGDPEMIFLNPVEQNIDKITVYSASEFRIEKHFINVVIKSSAVQSFKLDGASQAQYFVAVPGNTEYSYAQVPVPAAGVHNLQADEGFNAIAYGFGSAESYGYSAGTNLKGMDIYVEDKLSGKQVTTGCAGADLSFRIALVYPVSKLTWDFKNGTAPVVTSNLQADSTYTQSGKTFYVYKLNQDVVFTDIKDYQIEITAEKIFSDGCGNKEVIPFDFSVYSAPAPDFTAGEVCLGDTTDFTDLTDDKGKELKTWHWDFGDGNVSSEQNPRHVYLHGGTYNVRLSVTNATSCGVVSVVKSIKVIKKPSAGFEFSGACPDSEYTFTNKSVSDDGQIKKWHWNFGDGAITEKTTSAEVKHIYALPGVFQVKLRVETEYGCSDSVIQQVVVNHKPVANFIIPKVCLTDTYAFFTDSSTIANNVSDNSVSGLSYHWDFGDPNATALNPNTSNEKNPKHRYTQLGQYTAELTVVSTEGCVHTVSKTFTVNGTDPIADFEIANPNQLCSNEDIVLTNKARVGFGTITRVEWIYDVVNHPLVKEIDENPYSGKIYRHKYPSFFSPATKEYVVKQIAYSGTTCVDEETKIISIKAVTEVSFTMPDEICFGDAPLQLIATEAHGLNGSGVFSGTGISSSGLFRPKQAGPGTHTITYNYNIQNGCRVTSSMDITVLPQPVPDAGEDKIILAFGQVPLKVNVDIPVISYKWTPATGLNRDDIADPVASPMEDIIYTVTVVTDKGCRSSAQVAVRVQDKPDIPNTFTPNGDGINDSWTIRYLESLPRCSVNIFSRNGQKVFSFKGYPAAWDGKLGGADLPVGTYYYIIDPGNGKKSFFGYVAIVR